MDYPRVHHFLKRYRESPRTLRESLERAAPYLTNIRAVFAEEGLPLDLSYLPIVESGFRTHAVSPAGAVGPWQFMRGTARRYGLRIDPRLDERRDPETAARAAARYLHDLYDRFGDWPLSLAAYNIGEGKVARARSRAGNGDYWELCRRMYFPRETRDFVPRFLAVLQIAAEPGKFGLPATAEEPAPHRRVFVEGPLSLGTVADLSGTGLREVETLNPALRRGSVPSSGYPIRLPRESADRFQLAWAQLEQMDSGIRHTVHRGETPGAIARRYRVDLGLLMRLNGIRNPRRLQIGTELRVPFPRRSARAGGPRPTRHQLQALN